ncbi:recombination-associated protein RdgC [Pseudomonas sp.]|uniref:recombination-associated protein RdgC n=1 Tax=Pseudomonas sp. TaxID=306 RepID=UPI003FD8ACCD
MKLIKNAVIYSAKLPDAHNLAIHLAELPYAAINESQLSRSSFVPNKITNELVTEFNGGLSFSLRFDEKILPKNIVKARALERIAHVESLSGQRLSKVERLAIVDDVHATLAKTALVKTAIITAFYYIADNLLIVPVSNKRLASIVVGNLVHVVGSVKTTTINISDIKNGLTTRLTNHLNGDAAAFEAEGFALGEQVSLTKQGQSVSYKLTDLETAKEGILDRIEAGFTINALGLTSNEIEFKLTADFLFKQIDIGVEIYTEEGDDAVYLWKQEASVQTLMLAKVVRDLCELLGYKPPVEEEQSALDPIAAE